MATQSAVQRALALPEILVSIMTFLYEDDDDSAALLRAALVSRDWAAQAIDILWRDPPVEAIMSIPHDRRQSFASKVHHLTFNGDEGRFHDQLADLSFTSLRSVDIDAHRSPDTPFRIAQYLQFPLESLRFYGGDLQEDLLGLLREKCPRLQTLLLDSITKDLDASQIIPLLEERKQLKEVSLHYFPDTLPDDVFLCLARLPYPRCLTLLNEVEASAIEAATTGKDKVDKPFQGLRTFMTRINSGLLPALLSLIGSVRELDLSLWGCTDGRAVLQLAAFTRLESLQLSLEDGITLTSKEVLGLKSFPKLRTLRFGGTMENTACFELTDEDLASTLKRLPLLESLDFGVQIKIPNALILIGKYCRRLRDCTLPGDYDIGLMEDVEEILFPRLQHLDVGDLLYTRSEEISPAVSVLRRHAPTLNELDFEGDSELTDSLLLEFVPGTRL